MPRMVMFPRTPIGAAFLLWRVWRKLTPAQRRVVLEAARTHGPKIAVAARQAMRTRRA